MMKRKNELARSLFCFFIVLPAVSVTNIGTSSALADADEPAPRMILAHYMPWYTADAENRSFGWHWTMNAFDPTVEVDGRRKIASHYYPLIGPYDSGDPDALEYHLLLMKLAGIDGVIVDWYGLEDFRDYAILHRNTKALVDQTARLGMKVAICYEDQTIPALVEAGRLAEAGRVAHAKKELKWLADNWFPLENYVKVNGRPLLLSFGQTGLTDQQWTATLSAPSSPVTYISQHLRRSSALGAFDWPIPKEGIGAIARFERSARQWKQSIPVAFPRFVDIYAEAKVHASYGRIEDDDGRTFETSLRRALQTDATVIQIATWNDWGEGTSVEPSREFGYRDLEAVQRTRRKYLDAKFAATKDDLRLPYRLLELRQDAKRADERTHLDQVSLQIAAGNFGEARAMMGGN